MGANGSKSKRGRQRVPTFECGKGPAPVEHEDVENYWSPALPAHLRGGNGTPAAIHSSPGAVRVLDDPRSPSIRTPVIAPRAVPFVPSEAARCARAL
jgi:hypothetical protein